MSDRGGSELIACTILKWGFDADNICIGPGHRLSSHVYFATPAVNTEAMPSKYSPREFILRLNPKGVSGRLPLIEHEEELPFLYKKVKEAPSRVPVNQFPSSTTTHSKCASNFY